MMSQPRKTEHRADGQVTVVDVGRVRFGRDPFPVIAGPRAVESQEQMQLAARIVADAGASLLRGGTFKPQSSPYGFSGLGAAGLELLEDAGREVDLPTVTKVLEPADVSLVAGHVDMLHLDPGSMQDFELLREVGASDVPVLLERGPSATVEEWLWAAEYILAEGTSKVVLCEGGIRTFEQATNSTLDLSSVPVLKEQTHLPVIVAPSHAAGSRSLVRPLSLAAQGVGANGLMVEVHPQPDQALTGASHQLDAELFGELMDALGVNRLRNQIDFVDRDIVQLLRRRQDLAMAIGDVKAARGIPVHAPGREEELLEIIREEARAVGVDEAHVAELFDLILAQSRALQHQAREE